jgi:hypothetical protein
LAESSGLHAPFIGRRIITDGFEPAHGTSIRKAKKLAVVFLLSARRSSARKYLARTPRRAHIFRFPRRKRKTRPQFNRTASR